MSRFLLIACILIIVAGCRKNEFVSDDKYALLSITPVVNKDEATVAHHESYIDQFKIGIQVTNSKGSELYFHYTRNLLLSYSDKWVLSKPVCLSVINAKIFAYYPFTEFEKNLSGLGETAFVYLDIPKEQVMAQQTDYMYASQSTYLPSGGGPIFYANPNVILELNHALSLVSFVIFKEDFPGAGKLSNISVNTVESSVTESTDPGVDQTQLKTMVNGYMYVVPSRFSDRSNVTFLLTIDGVVYTITHTGDEELTWIKGYQYIYKLRLTKTSLSIVDIIISDWDVNYGGEIIIL